MEIQHCRASPLFGLDASPQRRVSDRHHFSSSLSSPRSPRSSSTYSSLSSKTESLSIGAETNTVLIGSVSSDWLIAGPGELFLPSETKLHHRLNCLWPMRTSPFTTRSQTTAAAVTKSQQEVWFIGRKLFLSDSDWKANLSLIVGRRSSLERSDIW